MKTPTPTAQDIDELVAFLPRLYAGGFVPVTRWRGGTADANGVLTMPWPEYDELVEQFFRAAARECWRDYGYRPEDAARMLTTEGVVEAADLAQIKTILTYCVRGERFCDGHWGAMIEEGHIRRLLTRLVALRTGLA